jgi:hypothetical protein
LGAGGRTWHRTVLPPHSSQARRRLIIKEGEFMASMNEKVNETNQVDDEFSQTEGILPFQFFGNRRSIRSIEPLRRLMVAMLVDAVRLFQAKFEARQPSTRQEFAEVQGWIFSDDQTGMFSFRPMCEALEIDPETIRKGLTRWKEKRVIAENP